MRDTGHLAIGELEPWHLAGRKNSGCKPTGDRVEPRHIVAHRSQLGRPPPVPDEHVCLGQRYADLGRESPVSNHTRLDHFGTNPSSPSIAYLKETDRSV